MAQGPFNLQLSVTKEVKSPELADNIREDGGCIRRKISVVCFHNHNGPSASQYFKSSDRDRADIAPTKNLES